jgi:D-alanyl-D-alanine endopeptidase (penicillin-binding protein 7)
MFLCVAPMESFAAKAHAKHKTVAVKKAKHKASKAKARAKAHRSVKISAAARPKHAKKVALARRHVVRAAPLPDDPMKLPLAARVAYVVDTGNDQVLLGKNDEVVRPIASLTKLMTGLIVAEARLPMDERLKITGDDVDHLKHSSSRLQVGTVLTRRQALHLALMSSENRAAHALARTYPGGLSAFVSAMNNKARQLGMEDTHYVEPTGLSPHNQSSARDLAVLAEAAYQQPLVRKFSTSRGYEVEAANGRELRYVNTNRLVREGSWKIGLQKTGYISEAGQCLIVQTVVKGRNLVMVFLDSASKFTRIRDAEIVKRWLHQHVEFAADGAAPDA